MSIGSAVFAQRTVECPITLQWASTFSSQNCPFPMGSGPPSYTWYLGPTQVINPNSISISSAIYVWVPNAMLYNASSMRKKNLKLPLPIGISPPTEGGPSHGDRQHAQKIRHRSRMWFGRYARGQTDTHTYALITILCHCSRG